MDQLEMGWPLRGYDISFVPNNVWNKYFLLIFKKISKNSLNQEGEIKSEVKEREFPAELPGSEYKMELVWRNIIIFIFLHAGAVYGYMVPKNSWSTIVFCEYNPWSTIGDGKK